VERLTATGYEGDKLEPPVAPSDIVASIRYFDDRKPIGFLELARRAGEGEKAVYVARTEHTRWWTSVVRSAAEQIEQDMKSVVSP
jgi:hypothetical protein